MGAIGHTSKFIRTQRIKHPTSVPLMLLLGHICSLQVLCSAAPLKLCIKASPCAEKKSCWFNEARGIPK